MKLRQLLVAGLALASLAVAAPSAGAVVGEPITSGPKYDRNASVVQDGNTTYLFFARSQVDCNRLVDCNPDQRKYDLFVKTSKNGGESYGSPQLVAANPDPTPDVDRTVPYGGFRGRTIAATTNGNRLIVFWADGGNERELYKVEKVGNSPFSTPTPVVVPETVFNVEAVTRGAQTFLYTEGRNTGVYGVYAHAYNPATGTAGAPVLVSADKNIPKAIVDKRGMVRMTYVDATGYPKVDDYVNSSRDGLTFTDERLAVPGGPTQSNWDPNLAQVGSKFVLVFAPDRNDGRQQIAAAASRDFTRWSGPVLLTPAEQNGVRYWDYWPEPYTERGKSLYYTSERGFPGNPVGTGHIWVLEPGSEFDDD